MIDIVDRPLPRPSGPFDWVPAPWGQALRCRPLAGVAVHLFTTRALALDGQAANDGWRTLARTLGVSDDRIVRLTQVHGAGVFVVRAGDGELPRGRPPAADIVVSGRDDVAVTVQVADCVPVLLADARTGVVAAVHAGWRGLAQGAPAAAVAALARESGSDPSDLVAALGPSIGPCCYEVGEDVLEQFRRAGVDEATLARWFRHSRAQRLRLDLWRAVSDQLTAAGIPRGRIHACRLCTATHRDVFYSYRADGPGTGRLVGVIRATRRGGDPDRIA